MHSVVIRIEGIESRRRSSGPLHLICGLFLIIKASDYYKLSEFKQFYPILLPLLAGSFSIFYGLFRKRFDPLYKYNNGLRLLQLVSFLFLAILMINIGTNIFFISTFVFVILALLLFLSERRIFHETALIMDQTGIRIPGYYRDHLVPWEDVGEVVVREDFLTVFHVKQKYLQYQIVQDLSPIEVAKMNAFCKEQIEKKGPEGLEEQS